MNNSAVKLMPGLLLGAVGLAISLILYILGPSFMGGGVFRSMIIGLVTFAIMMTTAIVMGVNIRKEMPDGFISFKDMFLGFIVMFAVASLITTITDYVLFGLLNPDFMVDAKDYMLSAIEEMSGGNMSDADLAKADKDLSARMVTPTAATSGISFITKMVFWAIISLILAAIMKRKQPDFA